MSDRNEEFNARKVSGNQQKDGGKPISRQEQIMKCYKEAVRVNGDALKRLSQN